MPTLPIDVQAFLDQLDNVPLDSSALDRKPLSADLSKSIPFGADELKVTLNVRGRVDLALFNSADDTDADGLLVPADSKGDVFGGGIPALELTTDGAWLKYRYEAGLKAEVGSTLAAIGFKLAAEADASAVLYDYRRHDRRALAHEAIVGDVAIGEPRLAAVLAHVEALERGNAVALQLAGTLTVGVTVSWADVFTSQLGALSALLKSSAPIAIAIDAGASVSVHVGIDDDFIVAFARVSDDRWQVSVKKAKTRSIGAALGAGIKVGFANPAQLQAAIQPALDGLFAATADKVTALLNKASLDNLSDAERTLAEALFHRLGLDPITATLDQLKQRIADVKAAVQKTVEDAVKAKVSLAFAYEYQRTDARTELLQATMTRQALRQFHGDCVRGNFLAVLDVIRRDGRSRDVKLLRYVDEIAVEKKSSWGFTLNAGKWFKASGKDTRDIKTVVRRDVAGREQQSYLGFRGYTGSWAGKTMEWGGDLKADQIGFSDQPRASEFEYGLHLLWKMSDDRLSDDDIDIFLDAAVLWGAISHADAARMRPDLAAAKGSAYEAAVQVIAADAGKTRTLQALLAATAAAPGMASALAAAIPWRDGSIGRTHVTVRRGIYAPLYQRYLDEPTMTPSELALAANRQFAHSDFEDLGRLELAFKTVRPFTLAGLAELNTDTPTRAATFRNAFDVLRNDIAGGAPAQQTLKQVFHDMSAFWEQSHHVRAAGAFVVEVARTASVLPDVERTATFTVDGKALVVG